MTGWLNEVDTRVDSVINNIDTVDLVLSIEIRVESLLDIVDDWAPGLIVVNKVAESRRVNDGETQPNTVLLNI